MDRFERRRIAFAALIEAKGHGGIASVADQIDVSASYVSRMLYPPGKPGRKRIGEELWDKLVARFPDLDPRDAFDGRTRRAT